MRQRLQILISLIVVAFIIVLGVAHWGAGLWTDWLWFRSLHYGGVFLTIVFSNLGLRAGAGILVFIVLFVNLLFTRRAVLATAKTPVTSRGEGGDVVTLYQPPWAEWVKPRIVMAVFLFISLVLGFLVSAAVSGDWVVWQQFLHPTSFHLTDPVFHLDIGFYVFKLPFYNFVLSLLMWTTVLTAFAVAFVYFVLGIPRGLQGMFQTAASRYHLSALVLVYFLLKVWGYRLDQYMLLYSQEGVVYGPGYTDIHAVLLGYRILMGLAVLCAAAVVYAMVTRRFRLVPGSVGALIVVAVLLLSIYPALLEHFVVLPAQYTREKPYIERSITYTRRAYALNKIKANNFPADVPLTKTELSTNGSVINSIRLWDEGPLLSTYNQMQTMRLYYTFPQIDVDRYTLNGQYRQVMVSTREIDQSLLPQQAQTWVNEKLKYTHGYGVAMSPVNKFTSDGLPTFFIQNIPPESDTNLKLTKPSIYYGLRTNGYVVLDTDTREFDYPKGSNDVYDTYKGTGGVSIGNYWRRLLFAYSFSDYNLLFSSDLTKSSRVLYYRNILQRVPKLAPFLQFSKDPYPVVYNGQVYWILDAYTETNMYPYSQPFANGNDYMRNSVKAVVNAYNGKVTFYIADPTDPLIQTWSKIFPGMFKPLAQMPAGLRTHIRYPVGYFTVQAEMYATYHMTDPEVFYNKEDQWALPAVESGQQQQETTLKPYYIITRLPGESKPEYVLIVPYTPQNKSNMVAWMAARMDGTNYGKLDVYVFPKRELVYGPQQINAVIDQNTTISQQLTLWNQQGSRVVRGNLMLIPIDKAIVYVEPLYLKAQQSQMPELARVIVAQDNNVSMEPTLEQALDDLFQASGQSTTPSPSPSTSKPPSTTTPSAPSTPSASLRQLAQSANQVFTTAQKQLQAGDWAGYGASQRRLKEILDEMQRQSQGNLPAGTKS